MTSTHAPYYVGGLSLSRIRMLGSRVELIQQLSQFWIAGCFYQMIPEGLIDVVGDHLRVWKKFGAS